jgi:hypothetical protein
VHPLAELIIDAVDGRFLPVDGGWHRVPPWRPGVEAVVAFTGHAVLAVDDDITDARLAGLGVDGYGGANHPRVLMDVAGPDGWIDSLDAVLVWRPERPPRVAPLIDRPDLADHPRVQFAQAVRDDVRVLGPRDGSNGAVATVSRGIGGLTELSVELDDAGRGRGGGAALVAAAVAAVPDAEVVVAAVAPGNAASLRAFLRAGFVVVGSVQLIRPDRLPRS